MHQHASSHARALSSVPPYGTPPNPPVPPRQPLKSSIVTFTRPGLQRDGSEGNVGSLKGAFGSPRDFPQHRSSVSDQSRSAAPSRSFSRSAPQGSITGFLLPRPEMSPVVQQRGFQTAAAIVDSGIASSAEQPLILPVGAQGGLSRELSEDRLPQASASSLAVQERLQKCLDAPTDGSAARSTETGDLLKQLQARHVVFEDPLVAHAFGVAVLALDGLMRRDGEPRLLHAAATAGVLADMGLDPETVAAGLLHEVLDASMMTGAQMVTMVAAPVVDMVKNVSRISQACILLRARTEEPLAADEAATGKLTTMMLAMADVRAVLVNLAARLHQLRGLAARGENGPAAIAVAEETLRVFAPLANCLGIWSLKAEMEDLCFQALYPEKHQELEDVLRVAQTPDHLQAALTQLKGAMDKRGLHYDDLSGRPKNLCAPLLLVPDLTVWRVQQDAAEGPGSLDQVYDVRALRIIVKSKEDCYAALREVEKLWPSVEGRQKDYIRRPKDNGYKSLHTVVRGPDGVCIEVQIRTAKMHYIAEYGIAAHWRYKEALGSAADSNLNDQLVGWARWMITWQLELGDGKTRPSGSPPRDTSLAAFAGSCDSASRTSKCTFPVHDGDCKFAKYLQAARLAPAPSDGGPVLVVLLNEVAAPGKLPQIAELPAGITAGQLLTDGLLGPDVEAGAVRLLVNNEEVQDAGQLLCHGDQVEVFPSDPADSTPLDLPLSALDDWATSDLDALEDSSWVPDEGLYRLDGERARLDRIFSSVPASSGREGSKVWRGVGRDSDSDIYRVTEGDSNLSAHLDALFARPDFLSAR